MSEMTSSLPSRGPTPSGLHPNPNRTRSASVMPEVIHIRPPSGPAASMDEDMMTRERTPLLSKTVLERNPSAAITLTVSSCGSAEYSPERRSFSATTEPVPLKGIRYWLRVFKVCVLFGITVLCCVVLMQHSELELNLHETVATTETQTIYNASYDDSFPIMEVMVMGPFNKDIDANGTRYSHLFLVPQSSTNDTWTLQINETALKYGDMQTTHHQFQCHGPGQCNLSLRVSEENRDIPLVYSVHQLSTQVENETIYAALILVFVYFLIIFELVHRTLAAMLGALAALAVLAAINQRPTTDMVVRWMEMETLMLLFGMMVIVAVLSDTGVFNYCAFKAYQFANGKVWPLITLLCTFSAVVSAVLDNVTTILLMAPVTIRLCEVLNLEPRVILIAEVLFSNIGGTATAIGDPPNVIIASELEREGVTFGLFTLHLFVGILFVTIAAYMFIRLFYRNIKQLSNADPPDISDLKHEVDMWRRAASRLSVVTREESLMKALFLKKAVELENMLTRTVHRRRREEMRDLHEQFRQLERDCQIKDRVLLVKCGFVLVIVVTFLFVYSFVSSIHISLGWIAILGAMWLLVLADTSDLESILHKVEWSTLLFFAALFILMEALVDLKLMEWIGEQMKELISKVHDDHRMTAAVVIIIWISALASSFIDNIPYTTAMIPILKQLYDDPSMHLELLPMVIALAFGACLGGNGTLIGASANVVCAGIAEQHGYAISFKQFFKVGFPMMLVTTVVATVYLLVCHTLIKWNEI